MVESPNQSQPNPGSRADGTLCRVAAVPSPTLIAKFPVESGLAVAHLPRGRGRPHVDALAVPAAVLVLGAVVLELAAVAVEARLAATPAGERPAVAAAAVFAVLAGRDHGDVGARPEEVARRPLAGLADEPEGAVFAGEAVGEGDGKALCPATSCFTRVTARVVTFLLELGNFRLDYFIYTALLHGYTQSTPTMQTRTYKPRVINLFGTLHR